MSPLALIAVTVLSGCTCDSEVGGGAVSSTGADAPPSADIPIDACADAVDVYSAEHAAPGEDWRILSPEDAAPLSNAKRIIGAIVFLDDGASGLQLPCLEEADTIWIVNTALTDLSAFSRLERIGADLFIQNNAELSDLSGLGNLRSVGRRLDVSQNQRLASLTGLDSLESAGKFSTSENPALINLPGMPAITAGEISASGEIYRLDDLAETSSAGYVINSDVLTSLAGLPIRPVMDKLIFGGPIDSLQPLSPLHECGFLLLGGLTHIETLAGLEGLERLVDRPDIRGQLRLHGNPKLRDISALSSLVQIDDVISIEGNEVLESLDGLHGVSTTRQLAIRANEALSDVDALLDETPLVATDYIRVTTNALLPRCRAEAICGSAPGARCVVGNNDEESVVGCQ